MSKKIILACAPTVLMAIISGAVNIVKDA